MENVFGITGTGVGGGYLSKGWKGAGGVRPIANGGFRLLPQSVNPHSSHVKGGRVKGLGRKLGFCGGVVVSGDHGINSWSTQQHGDDKCGLGSRELTLEGEFRSTSFYFFYALERSEREGSPLRLLERSDFAAPLSESGEGVVGHPVRIPKGCNWCCWSELRTAQLRAVLCKALDIIGPNPTRVAGIVIQKNVQEGVPPRAVERHCFDFWISSCLVTYGGKMVGISPSRIFGGGNLRPVYGAEGAADANIVWLRTPQGNAWGLNMILWSPRVRIPEGMYYYYCMPDLSGAQLRAALCIAQGYIGPNYDKIVGIIGTADANIVWLRTPWGKPQGFFIIVVIIIFSARRSPQKGLRKVPSTCQCISPSRIFGGGNLRPVYGAEGARTHLCALVNKRIKILSKLFRMRKTQRDSTVGGIERENRDRFKTNLQYRRAPAGGKHSSKSVKRVKEPYIQTGGRRSKGNKNVNAHFGIYLILLRSGDVETNPGPPEGQSDPSRDREDEPFDDTVGCVLWSKPRAEVFRQNKLHLNAVLANRLFKRELGKRLSNALFHCNCEKYQGEKDGLSCYKSLIRVACASEVISNEVIRVYNQVIQGELCFICLHSSKGERCSMVEGSTCSDLCEQALLDKFRASKGDYHSLKKDLIRGWNLMFRNKTELRFNCSLHTTNKVCLINSVDFESLRAQLEDKKANSLAARKSRAKRLLQPLRTLPRNIADMLDTLNTGQTCAYCMGDLSIAPEDIVCNQEYSFNFCSELCLRSIHIEAEFNFHENRNLVMFSALARFYHLHLDHYRLTLKRQGHAASEAFCKIKNDKKKGNFRMEVKESSSYIVSFNCNGACNYYKIRTYCKEKKPAVVGLQEIKTEEDKKLVRLAVPGYNTVSGSKDTAILVREDLKITEKGVVGGLEDLPHDFVQIDAPGGGVRIINVYCRDGKLTYTQLSSMESFGKRTFCIGDFNAKHRQFLTHNQSRESNKNGDTLYRYLKGDNAFEQESKLHCHNVNSPNVYTRAMEDKWVQLDLIFSHPEVIEEVDKFVYEDSLLSDHKAVAVYCPGIFRPQERYWYYDEVIDWSTYDERKYRLLSQSNISKIMKSKEWSSWPLEERCDKIQGAIGKSVKASTSTKKQSKRKQALPKGMVGLIKERREKRIYLDLIASESNKRTELKTGESNIKLKWTDLELAKHKESEASYRRTVVEKTAHINEEFKMLRQEKWDEALTKLSELDPKKASKEYWRTINKLSGKGQKSEPPSYISYKGITASGPKEVANLFSKFYEDTFQPQENAVFDQEAIGRTNDLAALVREAWDKPEVYTSEETVQMETKDPVLVPGAREQYSRKAKPPRPTKHMKKTNPQLIDRKLYLGKKKPLPNIVQLDLKIKKNLLDIHNTDRLRNLKRRTIEDFEMGELLRVLSNTKRKAPGNDGIFINQIKDLHASSLAAILDLYNEIWRSGDFPEIWKKAILVPIPKKGKAAGDPLSYRPISLLPIMGKVLESLVHPRLERYLLERKLIPDFQTGFRKGHSTSINLRRLFSNTYFESTIGVCKRPTVSVFFDAKKAFDTVWHEGLICKMAKDGIPAQIIRFLGNWLQGRQLKVRIGKECSEYVTLKSGVPQGSVISPLLWNYWLGDCPAVRNAHAYSALYADDVALWVSHPNVHKLMKIANEEIRHLVEWIRGKRLVFTSAKTMAMVTHVNKKQREKVKAYKLYMDEQAKEVIAWQSQAVLLGILFHETGSFGPHIANKVRQANSRVRTLWRFNKVIDGDKLYKVYKAAIEPILTYGTEAFYESINEILAKKLLSVEFNAIRCCYRLRKETSKAKMLDYFKDSSIMGRIDKRRIGFLRRNLGQHLIEYNETLPTSHGRRHRSRNLFIPPRTPRDWRKILHVHKPRVFFSDLSEDTVGDCRSHHEFSMDKVIDIIGPHVNTVRLEEWERNREQDKVSCLNRGIPSYNMLDAFLEEDPDLEIINENNLERVMTLPKFFTTAPTRWELKAKVRWNEEEPPEDVYIGGRVEQRINEVPEPYQPQDFFDVFGHQTEEEGVHTPELSALEHREILRNIDLVDSVYGDLREPDDTEGRVLEGTYEGEGSRGMRGPDCTEEAEMPQYAEMVSYIDGLLQSQDSEGDRGHPASKLSMESEVLGYRFYTQESEGWGKDEVLADLEMEGKEITTIRGGYNLGEIASMNFADQRGIWAEQEETFPNWGATGGGELARKPGIMSEDSIMGGSTHVEIGRSEGTPFGEGRTPTEGRGCGASTPLPSYEKDKGGEIAPWAASAYLRAMAEEKYRMDNSGLEEVRLEEELKEVFDDGTMDREDSFGESPHLELVDVNTEEDRGGFLSSTQIGGHEEASMFTNREGRTLSPIGTRRKRDGPRLETFIVDLYQDEDKRLQAIQGLGGLTFSHSEEGDIDVQAHDGTSSIPPRHPPMNDSTVDWSLLGRRHSPLKTTKKQKGDRCLQEQKGKSGSKAQEDSGDGAPGGRVVSCGGAGIRIRKGRYSKQKKKKGHRGGRAKKRMQGFLSEDDFESDEGKEGCPTTALEGSDNERRKGTEEVDVSVGPEGTLGHIEDTNVEERTTKGEEAGTRSETTRENEEEDARRTTTRSEEDDERRMTTRSEEDDERRTTTRSEEDDERRTTTRMKKTGSRRRTHVVMVEDGRIRRIDKGPKQNGRAPSQMSCIWPRRDEVITPGMADPNRNIIGYRSQEVPVASARTSGVFWATSKTRDNRRFPGTMEKTLQGQGLEYVSVKGTVGGGEEDPLLWPGVRPPDVGPR